MVQKVNIFIVSDRLHQPTQVELQKMLLQVKI